MALKSREIIPIQLAMDNLAAIASIDLAAPGPLGIVKQVKLVTSEEEFEGSDILWLSGEGSEVVVDVLSATFRSIHQYLVDLSQNPEMDWDNTKMLHGIAAMMALVGESAEKMDQYLRARLGKEGEKIAEHPEYQALTHFYNRYFSLKMKSDELHEVSDTELKDMDIVRSDREYELFYICHEDGRPYYRPELLRHMRLACSFEADGESFEEDPILQIRAMVDRDIQASAQQILKGCQPLISDFYDSFRKMPSHHGLARALSMSVLALLLTANPRNLLHNTTGKTALQYFSDFHRFLREALDHSEYQKMIAYPPEREDQAAHLLLELSHGLCQSLFFHPGGIKQETIALLYRTMRRGSERGKVSLAKEDSFWSQLLRDDENYRALLNKFPSGPLLKILDLIREREELEGQPVFDPFLQNNLPHFLYRITFKNNPIDILHLPSPTSQSIINKVEIVDEFKGFLRALQAEKKSKRHLLINLQDRTVWREYPRSKTLEALQKTAEFNSVLHVVTIPKGTDFYLQASEYLNINKAEEFLAAFEAQLATPEECGFFFPADFKLQELKAFVKETLPFIHRHFFGAKSTLNRRAREDFIEIFYQFLILKLIQDFAPTSISFSCKDGVDTGAAQAASFYAFLKLIDGGLENKVDQDSIRWLFYAPALLVRERSIDAERLTRTLTALERVDTALQGSRKAILKEMGGVKGIEVRGE
jgi:hypothetical protein